VDEAVRHGLRQSLAVLGLNEVQHHTERCDPACASDAATISDEECLCHLYLGITLFEKLKYLPMHSCPVTVQRARFRQEETYRCRSP
jgi:hypothetical protein